MHWKLRGRFSEHKLKILKTQIRHVLPEPNVVMNILITWTFRPARNNCSSHRKVAFHALGSHEKNCNVESVKPVGETCIPSTGGGTWENSVETWDLVGDSVNRLGRRDVLSSTVCSKMWATQDAYSKAHRMEKKHRTGTHGMYKKSTFTTRSYQSWL